MYLASEKWHTNEIPTVLWCKICVVVFHFSTFKIMLCLLQSLKKMLNPFWIAPNPVLSDSCQHWSNGSFGMWTLSSFLWRKRAAWFYQDPHNCSLMRRLIFRKLFHIFDPYSATDNHPEVCFFGDSVYVNQIVLFCNKQKQNSSIAH